MQSASVFEIDTKTFKVLRQLKTGSSWTKMMCFSPDEKKLYAANWSGDDVSEIDVKSGKPLWEWTRPIAASIAVLTLAMASDSTLIIQFLDSGSRPIVKVTLTFLALPVNSSISRLRSALGTGFWMLYFMPGVLIGIGLIAGLNRPLTSVFYQSVGVLILALVVAALVFGTAQHGWVWPVVSATCVWAASIPPLATSLAMCSSSTAWMSSVFAAALSLRVAKVKSVTSKAACSPALSILRASASPMPGSSVRRPPAIAWARSSASPSTARAPFSYARILKGFSPSSSRSAPISRSARAISNLSAMPRL